LSSERSDLSKEWANDLLRYGINVLEKWWVSPTSHKNSVTYKILIVGGFIGQLERAGFWWQAKRLANHLHRFMAGVAVTSTSSLYSQRLMRAPKARGARIHHWRLFSNE